MPHQSKLSRRSVLGLTAAAGAAGLALPGVAHAGTAQARVAAARQRVVVIGGGVAGVSMAWLLDGQHDVVLLEAGAELGGHARSIDVTIGGAHIAVDAGAQYFGPKSHPTYWKLLTEVLHVPTVPAPMNLTVSKRGVTRPVLVSPDSNRVWPLFDPLYWGALVSMASFTDRGTQLLESGDRTTSAEDFINSLPVMQWVRDDLLFPLCGAMFGFSVPQVKEMSAFSVLAFVIRGLGDGFLAPYDYHNAVDGLRAVVAALSTGLSTVTTHVNSAATGLSRQGEVYHVTDSAGRTHVADHVVFAQPPYAAGPLVGQLAGTSGLVSTYNRFRYIPARVAIHADPAYMPVNRQDWSGFNVLTDGPYCEPSMWYGAFRDVSVFKSWVSHRAQLPAETIATFDYLHALETPDLAPAQAALAGYQGTERLWFAGAHTVDVASQDSALVSAISIAKRLAPASANLARIA
ncbi:FAD-dependent oxidoreductase [Catenuloplanes atrovinosus]|uniref:NAD/FAD-binding protein n=1 Tax=Catenuloplanes atrovinosus TaxID=137266 RepID=A0AAE4CAP6_9ACTN|nr:FAD-dependent oxidoreductase [Catenuloplanes atrovinosus]MDR7277796.1 putative NAD/FAD-binding protein [Catenuloplanes atrovinosus]